MGAICSTATPAPKKRETKFDVTKSPPGSPSLNHKASLKGWLDGLDVAGDTKRNLHDNNWWDTQFVFDDTDDSIKGTQLVDILYESVGMTNTTRSQLKF